MTDYVDGKARWLAEGLRSEGRVGDHQRIGALSSGDERGGNIPLPARAFAVRPGAPVREVVDRLRELRDLPEQLFVTTSRGRLVGTVDPRRLLSMARADELP